MPLGDEGIYQWTVFNSLWNEPGPEDFSSWFNLSTTSQQLNLNALLNVIVHISVQFLSLVSI